MQNTQIDMFLKKKSQQTVHQIAENISPTKRSQELQVLRHLIYKNEQVNQHIRCSTSATNKL